MNTAPVVIILTEVLTTVSVIQDYINIHKKEEEKSASFVMLGKCRQASSKRVIKGIITVAVTGVLTVVVAVMVTEVVAIVIIVTGLSSTVGGRVVTVVVVAAGIAIEVVTEEV